MGVYVSLEILISFGKKLLHLKPIWNADIIIKILTLIH